MLLYKKLLLMTFGTTLVITDNGRFVRVCFREGVTLRIQPLSCCLTYQK